ncbi:MAG: hypothetical protein WAX80_01670 [Minisyncoccia bacterium]
MNIVKEFIMPKGMMVVMFIILGFVVLGELLTASINRSDTVLVEGTPCNLKSFDTTSNRDSDIFMRIDCSGEEDEVDDDQFIVDYLRSPGQFTCTRYAGRTARCKMPEK